MVCLEPQLGLKHYLPGPTHRVYPQLCRYYGVRQLQTGCSETIGVCIHHVAAVPANEWSISSVLKLDYVAAYPPLTMPFDVNLENYLGFAIGGLNGDILVELRLSRRPEGIASNKRERVEPIGTVGKDEIG